MTLCHIVPSLEEKHGGPSKSVRALARSIGTLGEAVTLLSTHPSAPTSSREPELETLVFRRDRPQAFCPSNGLRTHLRSASYQIIHHHSLWLRTLHYAHRRAAALDVPLVISPRGMMSAWAWKHRGWRKRFARACLHPGALNAARGWHATSNEEADEIRALGFNQPICVAPNGVTAPDESERVSARAFWRNTCPAVTERPTAVFYSRFHRKKRVLELIDLWLERAPPDWLLLMVGLPEEYTAAQLEGYVMRASGAGRVRVFEGTGCPAPYSVGSIFLLPSHSENFGLVIAEAMAHGLPVVVTDATPWTSLQTIGAGWCVPWEQYGAALSTALAEGPEALRTRGEFAREHVLAHYAWDRSARALADFYRQLSSSNHPK